MKNVRVIIILLSIVFISGCYYDKEEILYPAGSFTCDTASVTYSTSVAPIISSSCNGCHSGSAPSFNLRLDNYAGVKGIADNGKLLGVINHQSGFSPMPKNAPKLSTCNINIITKWIQSGAPNN